MTPLKWRPIDVDYLPKIVHDRFAQPLAQALVATTGSFGEDGEVFYLLRCAGAPWWFACNAIGDVELDPTGRHRKRFASAEAAKGYAARNFRPRQGDRMKTKAGRLRTRGECIAVGCIAPNTHRGFCEPHYIELQNDLAKASQCPVVGCTNDAVLFGPCLKHRGAN